MPKAVETEFDNDYELGRFGLGEDRVLADKKDIRVKIEKALRAFDSKLHMPENNIVDENIRRSIFGIFS